MQHIDFLPQRFHQRALQRQKRAWRSIVASLFGTVVVAAACFQMTAGRKLNREIAAIEAEHRTSLATNEQLASLKVEMVHAQAVAGLYGYLHHPWLRSRVLAEIANQMPDSVALTELCLEPEALDTLPTRPAKPPLLAEAQGKEAPPEPAPFRDLKRLRERCETHRTVVRVVGLTSDNAALHAWVASLGKSPLFAKVELGSLENVVTSQRPNGRPERRAAAASRFDLRIVVRPAEGTKSPQVSQRKRVLSVPVRAVPVPVIPS